jgi:hypothetical protein
VVERYTPGAEKVIRYLTKYLTKSVHAVADSAKKKCFGGSSASKCGSTAFKWAPWVCAASYLYSYGASMFFELYGHTPTFRDVKHCIRLGVEDTGWASVDFLWEFSRWAG